MCRDVLSPFERNNGAPTMVVCVEHNRQVCATTILALELPKVHFHSLLHNLQHQLSFQPNRRTFFLARHRAYTSAAAKLVFAWKVCSF
jgi:hypothetical protein